MKKLVSAASLAMLAASASAQVYVGGNFGATHLNVDATGTTSHDDSGTGYKLFGGYSFNPNVAVELGYIDFGKAKATSYSQYVGILNSEVKSSGAYFAAALRGNLSHDFTGVARLGLVSMKSKIDVARGSAGYTSSATGDEARALLGLALEYSITKNFKVSADADFSTSAEIGGESGSVRMLSIGAQYSF